MPMPNNTSCGDWAGGIVKQYSRLRMPSPFSSSSITCLNSLGFQANMEGQLKKIWGGLHVSPRTAPSKEAKLCTYFAWFLRLTQLKSVPYFEIPMPISRLRLLMQFCMGSHALPVEQGRFARPAIPRHLRHCTLCKTRALGDERHFVFDCPHFAPHSQPISFVVSRCRWYHAVFYVAPRPEGCLPLPSSHSSLD